MAETYTWLAADPIVEERTRGYGHASDIEVNVNKNAYKETQKRLWAVPALLTGVKTR